MFTSSNSVEGSSNKRCAGCKHLRRRCTEDCILAPYFPSNNPERFEYVHKIFGAGNVARMLKYKDIILGASNGCIPNNYENLAGENKIKINVGDVGCLKSLHRNAPGRRAGPDGKLTFHEAYWRVKEPVYGSTGVVIRIQQEISAIQCELAKTLAQISMYEAHNAPEHQPPPLPPLLQQLDTLGTQENMFLFDPNDSFNIS
ncbi:putative LOB domain protein 4 [Carex littledalei]|uniref:Putative LOB domain protein 4 n=1 Tax=Carex littledalei TaxID=544730 RepID=A0A833RBB4_9POAL|nr:putative LOB domain protein 4 [Carex littledalei]